LNAAVAVALADPGVRSKLAAQGARPTGGSSADYAGYIQSEIGLWTRIVRESGATAE
jgi:tripartite-type tricarboxylate transporter receptor subunit TctC